MRLRKARSHGRGVFVVEIENWHPTKLNQLMHCHWSKAHRMKKADSELVAYFCWQAKVTQAIGPRSVQLTLTLKPRQRGGDPDAYTKVVLDSLVHCRALKDDNRQWSLYLPPKFVRGDIEQTTIELRDI